MKRITLILTALLFSACSAAEKPRPPAPAPEQQAVQSATPAVEDQDYQATEKNIEQLRDEFRRNKAAFVASAMMLGPEEAEKFWAIYGAYDTARTKIGDQRLALLREYSENFKTMTNAKAAALTQKHYAIQKNLLELRFKYVKKLQQALSFAQVEMATQSLIDLALAANVPLIQEAEKQQ